METFEQSGQRQSCAQWRVGPWQDHPWPAANALLTDPPYSSATHSGARSQGREFGALGSSVDYSAIDEEEAQQIAEYFAPRVADWAVIFCDHIAWSWHASAWKRAGWYVFAPVAWVKPNAPPRFQGDGPACSVEYLMIARPKTHPHRRASRPGHYLAPIPQRGKGKTRGSGHKDPIQLRRLVDDYTDPGGGILDPYGGTATMGAAAIGAGRVYVGSEVDPVMHAAGEDRIRCVPPVLPGLEVMAAVQTDLL